MSKFARGHCSVAQTVFPFHSCIFHSETFITRSYNFLVMRGKILFLTMSALVLTYYQTSEDTLPAKLIIHILKEI